jgi:hypothetical protein
MRFKIAADQYTDSLLVNELKYCFYTIHTVHCHLPNIKHSTNKLTLIIIIIIILDIIYNPCKPDQHVSIPSWDHHQGHL